MSKSATVKQQQTNKKKKTISDWLFLLCRPSSTSSQWICCGRSPCVSTTILSQNINKIHPHIHTHTHAHTCTPHVFYIFLVVDVCLLFLHLVSVCMCVSQLFELTLHEYVKCKQTLASIYCFHFGVTSCEHICFSSAAHFFDAHTASGSVLVTELSTRIYGNIRFVFISMFPPARPPISRISRRWRLINSTQMAQSRQRLRKLVQWTKLNATQTEHYLLHVYEILSFLSLIHFTNDAFITNRMIIVSCRLYEN